MDDEQSVNIMEAIPLAVRSYQSIKVQGFRVLFFEVSNKEKGFCWSL